MSSFISSSPSAHSSRTNLLPDSKVDSRGSRTASSISDKYSLSADPASWGASLHVEDKEPDDYLHNPDPRRDKEYDAGGSIFTLRGLANLGCISILCAGLIGLFGGYPIISYFTSDAMSSNGGFNLGGINGTGQVPSMGNWGLIDQDTPAEAYTRTSYESGDEMLLVFSDEFNEDGRTFYPGEDPYWEAVDLHYWVTNNLEWYDPITITTEGGALRIRLEDIPTRGMDYRGGMMTSWNKFCFTGGLVEVSVTLPGANNIAGLWPAVWALGNLGRAAYGATLEGMWPYTYDSCDVGTVGNQTLNGQPELATVDGDSGQNGALSFLPGQRLSRCTCPGESHPGPMHADGTYVGRSAPEIDIFEAQVANGVGDVSQSGQWAPFNYAYEWHNTSDNYVIYDEEATHLNTYKGGVFQQATSAVSKTNQDCYELETGCFSTYGFEYKPGYDDAYLLWISDNKPTWLQRATGMEADPRVEISARPVPQEPMYLLANLGMSNNFGFVDLENIIFPATMSIDWIRVYQKKGEINIGCDPASFPTQAYINEYIEAYTNPNLTTWEDDYKQPMPKNSFLGQC